MESNKHLSKYVSAVTCADHVDVPVPFLLRSKYFLLVYNLCGLCVFDIFVEGFLQQHPPPPSENVLPHTVSGAYIK